MTYKKKTKEERNQEIKELSEKIEKGVQKYLNSDNYKILLKTMSKFHSYSLNNQLLILSQMPTATCVAGFSTWHKSFNRTVNKGEKGIKILCPVPVHFTTEVTINKDTPDEQKVEKAINYNMYRVGYVFDESQTSQIEGKPVIEFNPCKELDSSVNDYKHILSSLESIADVPVRFDEIEGDAKGYYDKQFNEIVIQNNMSESQTIKTLTHELAHSLLHNPEREENLKAKGIKLSRSDKELEAESVAFIVCDTLGIDTSDYSYPYIGTWMEESSVMDHFESIRNAANQIISRLESLSL